MPEFRYGDGSDFILLRRISQHSFPQIKSSLFPQMTTSASRIIVLYPLELSELFSLWPDPYAIDGLLLGAIPPAPKPRPDLGPCKSSLHPESVAPWACHFYQNKTLVLVMNAVDAVGKIPRCFCYGYGRLFHKIRFSYFVFPVKTSIITAARLLPSCPCSWRSGLPATLRASCSRDK